MSNVEYAAVLEDFECFVLWVQFILPLYIFMALLNIQAEFIQGYITGLVFLFWP